jgi:hypothetical protein
MSKTEENNIGRNYNHDGEEYEVKGIKDKETYKVRTVKDDTLAFHGVNLVHNALN